MPFPTPTIDEVILDYTIVSPPPRIERRSLIIAFAQPEIRPSTVSCRWMPITVKFVRHPAGLDVTRN